MNAAIVYQKTARGDEEIKTRAAKLPPPLRTMLILVDGRKPLVELQGVAQRLGIKGDFAAELEGRGLIAKTAASPAAAPAAPLDEVARIAAARRFMNDTVVDALGIRSFFFTLKLERCSTRADLAALLDEYAKVIGKASSAEQAAVLADRAKELLS